MRSASIRNIRVLGVFRTMWVFEVSHPIAKAVKLLQVQPSPKRVLTLLRVVITTQ